MTDKPDPILEALAKPDASRIQPRLDEFQVPWCATRCPYYEQHASPQTLKLVQHCELLDGTPDSVCVPGVRILVNMANRLAVHEHES